MSDLTLEKLKAVLGSLDERTVYVRQFICTICMDFVGPYKEWHEHTLSCLPKRYPNLDKEEG